MMPICSACGHVIRGEVKTFDFDFFDTRCHRQYISDIYDGMVEAIPGKIARYFALSGVKREIERGILREFIKDYRSLSY